MKYFIWFVIFVVFAAIVAGFFVVGSPKTERMRRFDDQRVSDLQTIQSQVVYYWQQKGKLPATLSDLNNDLQGYRVPVDPETNVDYGYTVNPPLSFSICATFDLASDASAVASVPSVPIRAPAPYPASAGRPVSDTWSHAAGNVCFSRTIDPAFYKPVAIQK